jgi:hypothetical protein
MNDSSFSLFIVFLVEILHVPFFFAYVGQDPAINWQRA